MDSLFALTRTRNKLNWLLRNPTSENPIVMQAKRIGMAMVTAMSTSGVWHILQWQREGWKCWYRNDIFVEAAVVISCRGRKESTELTMLV